ncbi:hypothetical protein DFJ74DRAFT_709280 [Hyaloraphidium curvatum]|nr:hypothetical protein DFJ74DRAFT_709280 [Hyaloraphidium curvatum]
MEDRALPARVAVPFVALCAALVLFNKSERGRRFYAELGQRIPDGTKRAKYLMNAVTGKVAFASFWTAAALFALLDVLRRPRFLYDLRIQERGPPSPWYMAKIALFNLATSYFVIAPISKLMAPIWVRRGGVERASRIPSAWESVREMVLCELFTESWIFFTHRILHLPGIYSWVHKWHHAHTNPFAAANLFATPLEHAFQTAPSVLLLHLLPVHPSTAWFFVGMHQWGSACEHSGYAIPGATNSMFHNYHHRKFEGNYGIYAGIPFWDILFGTADEYFQWRYRCLQTHDWLTNRRKRGAEQPEGGEAAAEAAADEPGGRALF